MKIPQEVQQLGLTSEAMFDRYLAKAKTAAGIKSMNREVQQWAADRDYCERQSQNPALTPSVQDNFKRGIEENNRRIALNNWFIANPNYTEPVEVVEELDTVTVAINTVIEKTASDETIDTAWGTIVSAVASEAETDTKTDGFGDWIIQGQWSQCATDNDANRQIVAAAREWDELTREAESN